MSDTRRGKRVMRWAWQHLVLGPQPRRTPSGSPPGLPPSGLALEDLDVSSAGNAPASANLWLRRRIYLWLQGAPPLAPPARRSHAHGAAHAVVHRRPRRVACGLALLPRSLLTSCTHTPTACAGLCGAQTHTHTHTHTQRVPPRGGRGGTGGPQPAHARGARFSPRDALAMPTHSCTCSPPCAAHRLARDARAPPAPRRAWPLHALHAVGLSSKRNPRRHAPRRAGRACGRRRPRTCSTPS